MITTDRPTDDQIRHYREHGYAVVPGLLAPEAVAALRDDVLAVLEARNMPDSYLAQANEYLPDSPLDRFLHHPDLQAVAGAFLAGQAHLYLPFTAVKGPHQGPFKFHQDNQYTRLDGPACNCWFALGPCTVRHGCMQLVPDSHKAGTLTSKAMFADGAHRTVAEEPASWDDVPLEPGDCVVFDRLTIHGSGPNETDEPRIAYAVQFHREDVRWYDRDNEQWKLLVDEPRWQVGPVAELTDTAGRGE